MKKTLGILGLLALLILATFVWELRAYGESRFLTPQNIRNLLTWVGLFGILSLGQSLTIITGGIDLSVGSVVALVGIVAAMLLRDAGVHPALAIAACLALAAVIGAWHGLLVTRVRLQPFIVTLCGLFLYRGMARLITGDTTRGFGTDFPFLRWLGSGYLGDSIVPAPFAILVLMSLAVGAFLHLTSGGRHLFALGANEEAARYSGIRTHALKASAYVLCSLITGVGGLLIAFKVNSLGPSEFGNFYELYAIAGAVLGGCSLRGGAGSVPGVFVGAALIVLLKNLVNILGIPSQVEYMVIGGAILAGVVVDEFFTGRARTSAATA